MKCINSNLIKVFLVASLMIINSCHSEGDSLLTQFSSEQIYRTLKQAELSNLTIDSVQLSNDVECFLLSDRTIVAIPVSFAPMAMIGEDGYWYEKDVKTSIKWDSGYDILSELRSSKEYGVNELGEGDLKFMGSKETITGFFFYFSDGSSISISKSLFKYDLDAVMKTINHRGFRTVAPENTLESYRLARLNGFKYVETDIRFSKDDVPVLIHDESINRTSNGNGLVAEMTFDELRKYDYGSWKNKKYVGTLIPSLDEFLSLCCAIGLSPYLELKVGTKEQISSLVQLIQNYDLLEEVSFISYSSSLLDMVRSLYPQARLGVLANTIDESIIQRADYLKNDCNTVEILSSDRSDSAIALCYNSGYPLYVGSIDDPRLLYNLPRTVAGVTSNSIHAGWVLLNRDN